MKTILNFSKKNLLALSLTDGSMVVFRECANNAVKVERQSAGHLSLCEGMRKANA